MDLLADEDVKLRQLGVTLLFAQMRCAVRNRLERAILMDVIGPDNVFPSLAAAIEAYKQRHTVDPSPAHAVAAISPVSDGSPTDEQAVPA
jgi:hypothetical protein